MLKLCYTFSITHERKGSNIWDFLVSLLTVIFSRLHHQTSMCKLNKCCGFIYLRTGCIIISIVELCLGLANLSIIAIPYNLRFQVSWLVSTVALVLGVICGIVVWILLLFGALANNSALVIINLVFAILSMVIRAAIFIMLTVYIVNLGGMYSRWDTGLTVAFAFYLCYYLMVICLDIYFTVVIFNFYQALKYGGSGSSLRYPV